MIDIGFADRIDIGFADGMEIGVAADWRFR
jgi:hypothetical protein